MVKAWIRHDHPYAVRPDYPYIHARLPQIDDDMSTGRHCSRRKKTGRKKTAPKGSRENGVEAEVPIRDTKIDDYFPCQEESRTTEAPSLEQHSEVDIPCPNAAALPSAQLSDEVLQTLKTVVNKQHKPRKGSKLPVSQAKKQENQRTTKGTEVQSHALTEYFPVRRSARKTRTVLKKEKQKHVEELILSGSEEGFAVVELDDKGRGVITTKPLRSGEFVLEYAGDLIDVHEAKEREQLYAKDSSIGCYMYYFTCLNKQYCVDATKETSRLGRLVNHSKKGNLKTQTCIVKGIPRLVLVAQRNIEPGEELLYDYGDRSRSSLQSYPWLAF